MPSSVHIGSGTYTDEPSARNMVAEEVDIPRGTGHRDLDVLPFFLRDERLHVLKFGEKGTVTGVGYFTDGHSDLIGNLFLVHE